MDNEMIYSRFEAFCKKADITCRQAVDTFMQSNCICDINIRDMLTVCYQVNHQK